MNATEMMVTWHGQDIVEAYVDSVRQVQQTVLKDGRRGAVWIFVEYTVVLGHASRICDAAWVIYQTAHNDSV